MSEESFNIYSFLQLEAIEGKLIKSDIAFERRIRREFAFKFNISFDETFKLAWTDIVSHYYDSQIEDTPFNLVYNMAIDNYCPDLAEEEEREQQAFADSLVEEQKATLAKKKSVAVPSVKDQEPTATKEEPNNNKDIEMNFDMDEP